MVTTKLMTIEDIERLPDAQRCEIVRGEVREVAPSNFDHSDIALGIGAHLREFVMRNRLGRVVGSDAGFILARHPDTLLATDAAFVRGERLPPREQRQRFLDVVPDLVVEVLSPTNTATEMSDKVLAYLEAGIRLVWVVDPFRHTVTVYTPDRSAQIVIEGETLDGGEVLPGFSLPVADLFV
ncbi:MAG: Uma2 family endonuclease [Chloroflexi bacterium]|nr:MAG: Uma2 family endonuclease [Chloroflexota bacterium]